MYVMKKVAFIGIDTPIVLGILSLQMVQTVSDERRMCQLKALFGKVLKLRFCSHFSESENGHSKNFVENVSLQ